MQVELATGAFPYKNCNNDFEVLAKVVNDDPPVLLRGSGFSNDFCFFVNQWYVDSHLFYAIITYSSHP